MPVGQAQLTPLGLGRHRCEQPPLSAPQVQVVSRPVIDQAWEGRESRRDFRKWSKVLGCILYEHLALEIHLFIDIAGK